MQSELCKASEPQEIVSLVRASQNVWRIAGREKRKTESKAEELHSVERVQRICEVLCSRPASGL